MKSKKILGLLFLCLVVLGLGVSVCMGDDVNTDAPVPNGDENGDAVGGFLEPYGYGFNLVLLVMGLVLLFNLFKRQIGHDGLKIK